MLKQISALEMTCQFPCPCVRAPGGGRGKDTSKRRVADARRRPGRPARPGVLRPRPRLRSGLRACPPASFTATPPAWPLGLPRPLLGAPGPASPRPRVTGVAGSAAAVLASQRPRRLWRRQRRGRRPRGASTEVAAATPPQPSWQPTDAASFATETRRNAGRGCGGKRPMRGRLAQRPPRQVEVNCSEPRLIKPS